MQERYRLTADGQLLFATRTVRMFAYGFLSVLLVLYLSSIGLSDARIGLLLTLTLVGDAAISLFLTTTADRLGRRKTLVVGAVLMLFAGVTFALTDNFILLLIAATVGVISPSGNEVGPFLSVEQASLSHVLPDGRRTHVFAWYNLFGSLATAVGALAAGGLTQLMQNAGMPALASYRIIVLVYAAAGLVLACGFLFLTRAVEVDRSAAAPPTGARAFLGLHQSKGVVARLSGLFAIDAFGGGFVIQSILAYWFYKRWHVEPGVLGAIFFGANCFAAVSALSASWLASKIGLINTMVFTHLPSNVLLILVPLMPNVGLAITMLLLRFSISQMDVPTRQSYVMAAVRPDERSAAAGVTGVARSIGASISPSLGTMLMASPALMGVPFFLGGGLKIIYDLLLYRSFTKVRPPEERQTKA
jgi:MFS family permease